MNCKILLLPIVAMLAGCRESSGPAAPPRTYFMGFSYLPPRFDDPALVAPGIDRWVPHADAAIMHISPPWAAMIAGHTPAGAVDTVEVPVAQYFRAKGLPIVFTVDATDGLNRAAEAPELVAAGRSITDTAIQRMYRQWVVAVATKIKPEYLGLAAETNLIRQIAPDSVYRALVTMVNAAATQVRAAGPSSRLYVSVQVETAWNRFAAGPYIGIAQDLADFPFVQAIGLSSYPYLGGFTEPEAIPLDYYSRIVQGTTLPVLVVEGGWSSISLGDIMSSSAEQARYIAQQAKLLDSARAKGVFQLTFYDIDLRSISLEPGSILPLFAHLGLADSASNAKPALATWDSVFHRPRTTN